MLSVTAPAKLNLSLHITGKRADGYHTLESLVVFTSLHDTLAMEPAETLTLTTHGPFAQYSGVIENNLVMRAANALQQASGTPQGAALQLSKYIPVGAGLGGGSSDAAATLLLLNDAWALGFTTEQLHAIAVPLGADVAMFLRAPAPLMVRGIGDMLAPAPMLPALHAVLVYPNVPLATADVYANYTPWEKATASPLLPACDFAHWAEMTRNDLQPAATQLSPVVGHVLAALQTTPPNAFMVRMTGSGACCFALHTDADSAAEQARQLQRDHADWWVTVGGGSS